MNTQDYEKRINALDLNITGGCNRCTHHISKIEFDSDYNTISTRKCSINNDEVMLLWWEENGKKPSSSETTTNECFEATVHEKALTDLNNDAKKLLEMLKRYE